MPADNINWTATTIGVGVVDSVFYTPNHARVQVTATGRARVFLGSGGTRIAEQFVAADGFEPVNGIPIPTAVYFEVPAGYQLSAEGFTADTVVHCCPVTGPEAP